MSFKNRISHEQALNQAKEIVSIFLDMITGKEPTEEQLEKLEDAQALEGISHMPARVKCAVLAWRTLETELNTEEK